MATKPPKDLKRAGRALWKSVMDDYELEEHESRLLLEASRCVDLLEDLAGIVKREGLMLGKRVHPAAIEQRQARIALARLVSALRLPAGDEDDHQAGARRPQRRVGARGVYEMRSVS